MLTRFDELTCHQSPTTFDHVATSDRAFTEKLWCNIHDTRGRMVLATGLGIYPNRNVMDGYGCVNLDNKTQYNIRLSRELRPRIDETAVGPLRYEVVQPFKEIRVRMDENKYDLTYDLTFTATLPAHEEDPQFGRWRGRVFMNTCRYAQLGRARGWVKAGGQTIDVDEHHFYAQRDHSWGIRMGVGAMEEGVQEQDTAFFTGMMINWLTAQFEDWGVCYYLL